MNKQNDNQSEQSPVDVVRSGELLSDPDFLADMATYGIDHEWDGWPAIQQWQIARLIGLIYKMADNADGRLTIHVLRNWDRNQIDRFAKHLLGDRCQKCESR